jgi:hypothetical protein
MITGQFYSASAVAICGKMPHRASIQSPPCSRRFRWQGWIVGGKKTFNIDNLTYKVYYETHNYFETRITPDAPAIERIHCTPGYPIGFTVGLTCRLGEKNC